METLRKKTFFTTYGSFVRVVSRIEIAVVSYEDL